MKIIIFNDLHLCEKDPCSLERLDRALTSIRIENEWEEKLLILIPGDITNSGSSQQFSNFSTYIDRFKNDFSGRVDIIATPGNHDNNFKSKFLERKRADFLERISKVESLSINDFKGNPDLQKNFRDFNNKEMKSNFGINHRISDFQSRYVVYFNNKKICINVFNTAITSLKTNSRGLITIPFDGLDPTFNRNEFNLVISMFHYPQNWLRREKNSLFEKYVKDNSDIIIIGHEHIGEAKTEHSVLEESNIFSYLSPALYSSDCSIYSIFDVDFENEKIDIDRFSFDTVQNGFTLLDEGNIDLSSLIKKRKINKHSFYLSDDMIIKLRDYGVQLTHNKVSRIDFNNLYINPQFRVVSKFDANYENELEEYSDLIDDIEFNIESNVNKIFITGESDYGKTSFLKFCFNRLSDLDFVPVLCDLDNEKGFDDVVKLSNYIYQTFQDQYNQNQLVKFKDLDPKRRFLMIDNIDKYEGNLSLFLSSLSKYIENYPNVIITSSDKYIFDPFSKTNIAQKQDDFIDKFDKYKLLEFRNYLREKLINKWVLLGNKNIPTKKRIERVTKFERMINNLVKKNLLKPLPLYLIIIMQSSDMGRKLDNTFSSRPHFYNYLIIDAYIKLPFDNYEITEFEKYVTHLAYYITQYNLNLQEEEINKFHNDYISRMKISPRLEKIYYFNKIKEFMLAAKIIKMNKGVYSFNHPYHYCFYLSKYLVNPRNIGSEDTLLNLIENIHMELAANTLNFVIYHSNDDLVYTLIKEKAMSLLGEIEEFRMEDDIKKVNELYKDYNPFKNKKLEFVKDIDKSRANKNKIIDKMNEEILEVNQIAEENTDDEMLDFEFINIMNSSVRILEVMGGIIKHGIGVFDGEEKTNITRDTVEFGMRLITYFLNKIESVINHLFIDIKNQIEESKKEKSQNEVLEEFRRIIYTMLSPSIYGLVVKTADSIANTRDDIIFREVLSEKDTVACKIIDFTIEIFFFGKIDFKKMEDFLKENTSNSIATSSLIQLVGAYNQRFQISRVELQKFNSLLRKFNLSLGKTQSSLILENKNIKFKEKK